MVVTEASLSPNSEAPAGEHTNTFSLYGSVNVNSDHKDTAVLIAEAQMISFGKFELQIKSEFTIKFESEVSEKQAEELLEKANAEANIFPYISSYITGWLALSGYSRPNIPVIFFEDLK
ncbi:hypothetical protein LH22_17135 [Pantoea rwandensis]|uniref:Preprotein translocase subunit SecB n=2 Tax=Pantoea rwandensis TaxID=1076550 RepID=A0ABM5RM64_9GAMM|nr:hypothetical protein LH22_17135 [Pantoea rwandensis]